MPSSFGGGQGGCMPYSLRKLLGKTPSGLLVIMNFVDAVHCKALSNDLAHKFISEWDCKCKKSSSADEALSKMRPLRESHSRFFKNTGNELQEINDYIFTIMRYEDIHDKFDQSTKTNTKKSKLVSVHNLAKNFHNATDDNARSQLEDRILQQQEYATKNGYFDVHFNQNDTIKGSIKKLVWITTAEPGIALKDKTCHHSSISKAADITRDNLGLVHIGFDKIKGKQDFPLLVALKIRATELFSSTRNVPWRPTAIDAGNCRRFRGAYGDLRKNSHNNWGRAIHLEALSDRSGSLGATEAVVMDFRPTSAKMTFLGFPRNCYLPGNKDKEFVENTSRKRSQKILKSRFINI